MNPAQPRATHVAVREGRILGVGSREDLAGWGDAALDERYADHILMPGLVEGHCHLPEGGMWQFAYVGYYDRRGPDGRVWPGLKSFEAVAARLREFAAGLAPAQTLIDQLHARVERGADGVDGGVVVIAAPHPAAHGPGAQAHGLAADAGSAQRGGVHRCPFLTFMRWSTVTAAKRIRPLTTSCQ